tara:strand:+ start:219 stop:449 length:231 start_codon:yes stop_codon:yes gene_type:complete
MDMDMIKETDFDNISGKVYIPRTISIPLAYTACYWVCSEGGAAPDEMTLSYVQKYRHRYFCIEKAFFPRFSETKSE